MKPKIRRFTLSDLATGYPGDFGDDYIELLHFKDFAEPLAADGARLEECRFSSVQIQGTIRGACPGRCRSVPQRRAGGTQPLRVSRLR